MHKYIIILIMNQSISLRQKPQNRYMLLLNIYDFLLAVFLLEK